MALDQVEVMKHFGFDRFPVVGQDRGGRVGHRLALDHPDKVTRLAVLDIVPTYYHYTHVTIEFVQAYFHWFNYLRPAPGPENDLKAQTEAQRARATTDVQLEYLRTASDLENIHGMCEDYRAGASIDLKHDEADLDKKIACPLLVLWSERGPIGRLFDVMKIWRERGTQGHRQGARRRPLPAGGRTRAGRRRDQHAAARVKPAAGWGYRLPAERTWCPPSGGPRRGVRLQADLDERRLLAWKGDVAQQRQINSDALSFQQHDDLRARGQRVKELRILPGAVAFRQCCRRRGVVGAKCQAVDGEAAIAGCRGGAEEARGGVPAAAIDREQHDAGAGDAPAAVVDDMTVDLGDAIGQNHLDAAQRLIAAAQWESAIGDVDTASQDLLHRPAARHARDFEPARPGNAFEAEAAVRPHLRGGHGARRLIEVDAPRP